MACQVPWNKQLLETFIEEAALTDTEEQVIRTRVAGWSRQKQATEFGMSLSSLDKTIKRLKVKYDKLQPYVPNLPPRKFSVKEVWMDTH